MAQLSTAYCKHKGEHHVSYIFTEIKSHLNLVYAQIFLVIDQSQILNNIVKPVN